MTHPDDGESTDALLRELGGALRERDDDRMRPGAPGGDDDLRASLSAPLSPSLKAAIAARARAELAPGSAAEPRQRALPPVASPWRRRGTYAALVAALAAAIAIAFAWMSPPPSARRPGPVYQLDVAAGDTDVRGAPPSSNGELASVGPGAIVDIVLRPASRMAEPIALAVWLAGPSGTTRWTGPVEQAAGGVFRIHGLRDAVLPPQEGIYAFLFAIGPADRLPTTSAEVEDALRGSLPPDGWTPLRAQLRATSLPP